MKIRTVGGEFFNADVRTNRHDEDTPNAPKNNEKYP
jgi:hypothetical protein